MSTKNRLARAVRTPSRSSTPSPVAQSATRHLVVAGPAVVLPASPSPLPAPPNAFNRALLSASWERTRANNVVAGACASFESWDRCRAVLMKKLKNSALAHGLGLIADCKELADVAQRIELSRKVAGALETAANTSLTAQEAHERVAAKLQGEALAEACAAIEQTVVSPSTV